MDLNPPPLAPDGPPRAPGLVDELNAWLQRHILDSGNLVNVVDTDVMAREFYRGWHAALENTRNRVKELSAPPPVAGQEPPSHERSEIIRCDHSIPDGSVDGRVRPPEHRSSAGDTGREVAALAPSQESGVSVIPIPREALARNPFEYVTAPPHMPTDRQQSEHTAALAPSPAALEELTAIRALCIEAGMLPESRALDYLRSVFYGFKRLLRTSRALSPASAPHE